MSMRFISGIQDFFGIFDATQLQTSDVPSTPVHIASIQTSGADNARNSTTQPPTPKHSLASLNFKDGYDEKIMQCSHKKKVHFPTDSLVTGSQIAPKANFHPIDRKTINSMVERYVRDSRMCSLPPLENVLKQIECFHMVPSVRQECFSLKGVRLSALHVECLEQIFKYVQFDRVDFEHTHIDDDGAVSLAEILGFYDSAFKLNLSHNRLIKMRGWQALFRALENCTSLKMLSLHHTSFSDYAVSHLARPLRNHPSLTILHLENTALSGRNLLILVAALKPNVVLKELHLGENRLNPSDGAHLYQLILANHSIELLDLRNNNIGELGLMHICDALKHKDVVQNSALSSLVLWNNGITNVGMESLAYALIKNSKLETLNLGQNRIGTEGVILLKSALLKNSNLQRLGLQETNLDNQAAILLAECIAENHVLMRIDLHCNPLISSAGLLALHLAMKMNTSITLLNLDKSCATCSKKSKSEECEKQFQQCFEEIIEFCNRNRENALRKLCVQPVVNEEVTLNEYSSMDEFEVRTEMMKQSMPAEENSTIDDHFTDNIEMIRTARSTHLCSGEDNAGTEGTLSKNESVVLPNKGEDWETAKEFLIPDKSGTYVVGTEFHRSPSMPSLVADRSSTSSSLSIKQKTKFSSLSSDSLPSNTSRFSRFKVERVSLPSLPTAIDASSLKLPSFNDAIPLESNATIHACPRFSSNASNNSVLNDCAENIECSSYSISVSHANIDSFMNFKNAGNDVVDPIRGINTRLLPMEKLDDTESRPSLVGFDDIKLVVQDLINFTAYEMGEVSCEVGNTIKISSLQRTNTSIMKSCDAESITRSEDVNNDEHIIIYQVVRNLVRDVLKKEREVLRSLRHKRQNGKL